MIVRVAIGVLVSAFTAWSAAALAIDGPVAGTAAKVLGFGWIAFAIAVAAVTRSFARTATLVFLLDVAVTSWWLSIAPSNDRTWLPEVSRLASVDLDGDLATFHGVRAFDYHSSDTDYTARWEDRTYDLSTVRAV